MKSLSKLLVLFYFLNNLPVQAQDDTLLLTRQMFEDDRQQIFVSNMDAWRFQQGDDPAWAAKNYDASHWVKMKPTDLTIRHADKSGRAEGWFRTHIKLDSSFAGLQLGFRKGSWVALDLYVNGKLFKSFGNTGTASLYREDNPSFKFSIPYSFSPDSTYSIAIHLVDYQKPFRHDQLKLYDDSSTVLRITGPGYNQFLHKLRYASTAYDAISLSITVLLSLLLWFFTFLNRDEKNLRLMAFTATLSSLALAFGVLYGNGMLSFVTLFLQPLFTMLLFTWFVIVLAIVFDQFKLKWLRVFIFIILVSALFAQLRNSLLTGLIITFGNVFIGAYICISNWKKVKGAQKAFVVGILLTLIGFAFAVFLETISVVSFTATQSLLFLAFPLCMVIYVILRFKENLNEIQNHAAKIIQLSEEKKEHALQQQKVLEAEVTRQTEALRTSLETLQSTQAQLIQSEKLASLGELTAGIAHEIQNPLNFVNNFAELNRELITELKEEIVKGNYDEVKAIAADLETNEERINHHGQRASSIVKGMLEHSRSSTGTKAPTDLNALADEYLRLAYHGFRAKDPGFTTAIETHFDPNLPLISVIPQDIGRVLLNLINNAFYACAERSRSTVIDKAKLGIEGGYEPLVSVSTERRTNGAEAEYIEIRVKDNGNGIPTAIREKIFQPFFTTKPTGQGTGLGLSLAYDIVVKGHGGSLDMESTEGEGTAFIVLLPC